MRNWWPLICAFVGAGTMFFIMDGTDSPMTPVCVMGWVFGAIVGFATLKPIFGDEK